MITVLVVKIKIELIILSILLSNIIHAKYNNRSESMLFKKLFLHNLPPNTRNKNFN